MEEHTPFGGLDDINQYLNKVTHEIESEASYRREHMLYLGKELRELIYKDNAVMDEVDRSFLHEAFYQAVYISTEEPLDDPYEKLNDIDKKSCFYTLRDAMVTAIDDAKKSSAFKEGDLMQSLEAMINLVEYGKCTKEQRLPILRFIAFTVRALAKALSPFKA